MTKDKAQAITTIKAIETFPEAILVDIDYDVLHTLVSIGLLDSVDGDGTTEPETWARFWAQDYHGVFVLLDDSGADYLAVWGYVGSVPYVDKQLELLWYDYELLV